MNSCTFLGHSFLILKIKIKTGSSPFYFTRVALRYVLEELVKLQEEKKELRDVNIEREKIKLSLLVMTMFIDLEKSSSTYKN